MFRITAGAVAALILATSSFAGEVTDKEGTYRLTAPEGWTSVEAPFQGISLVIISPRRDQTGGNCNIIVIPTPATRSMSQAEVEAEFGAQLNEQFWRESIDQEGLKLISLDQWGDKKQRGRKVFFAKVTTEAAPEGVARLFKQEQNLHVIPGRAYAVTCTAYAEGHTAEVADFDSILASFEPLLDMTVAAQPAPAPSAITARSQGPLFPSNKAGEAFAAGTKRPAKR